MDFRIADTFTNNLGRLTGDEQKAVKTTAFDLQLNPTNPGMSFHKIEKARDKIFWQLKPAYCCATLIILIPTGQSKHPQQRHIPALR